MDAFTSAPQNNFQYDPDLRDLLDLHTREILLSLNCHAIGTIQSFNSLTQTVNVTINYSKTFFRKNPVTGVYGSVQVDYPPLTNVPIYILGDGAGCSLTFPIKAGATCSILFNDRDMSAWLATGQVGPLPSGALHAFGDPIALIGVRSLVNALTSYDTVRAVLQNGTTMVGVGATQVKIANAINGSLGAAMTSLLTALNTFMTACEGSSTDPTLAAAATAFTASAATAIAKIEGILE